MTIWNRNKSSHPDIVGLIPAGGRGKRIAPLPCSKELYPVGFHDAHEDLGLRPKVVSHYLLEKMRRASVTKAYIVLRKGKWDIPEYFGDGKILKMSLAYLMMDLPFGVPYTLNQAYPFVRDSIVAFGFPDILFQPDDAFIKLLSKQAKTKADLVLGLFPAPQPHKMDMVELDTDGKFLGIKIKPVRTNLRYTWIIAVWTPLFTDFMHEFISVDSIENDKIKEGNHPEEPVEVFLGDVVQAAADNDVSIESVVFPDAACLDIGTPEDLAKAISQVSMGRYGSS